MNEEPSAVVHELAVQTRKLLQQRDARSRRLPEIKPEDRELLRSELLWCAEYLIKNYKLTIPQTKQCLQELLTATV